MMPKRPQPVRPMPLRSAGWARRATAQATAGPRRCHPADRRHPRTACAPQVIATRLADDEKPRNPTSSILRDGTPNVRDGDYDEMRSNSVPDRPQIGKDRVEQRLLEELHARRAAGPAFGANRPLDYFYMPVAPLLLAFVEIRHQLKEDGKIRPRSIEIQKRILNMLI